MNARRSLHQRLSVKRALVGLLQAHPNPALAEMAGMCGYDFILLDDEHGLFGLADHNRTLQTISSTGVAGLIRLNGHDTHMIGRYLDMGADGIVVPSVSTAEQANALARAMEYPPKGTRGLGASSHRATRYGMDLSAHLQTPREGAVLLPIIETAVGAANAAEILAVDGVDGVIIGPSDLSADLGSPGDYANVRFTQAMAHIEHAAATSGKLLGTAPHPGSPPEALTARGHRLLIAGSDMSLLREAMTSQLKHVRAHLEGDADDGE